ncbi:MAG: zinc-binding dehydrogenase [Candidatus Rokubacteria bacterium]|nr:zinc-binding dehydrogenase [Candidatus Rokubacteria bacterium]
MRAARLYGIKDLRVEEVEDPHPGPGEALIGIHACGVCPSDVRGYIGARHGAGPALPRTPGHEVAGVIEALGPPIKEAAGAPSVRVDASQGAPPLRVGDRVVADWRNVCGRCYQCRRGVFNYCENMRRGVSGGFAQYGVAPLSQFRRIPDSVSFEAAAFTEPLACILNAHWGTRIDMGDDVVIIGAGPIGLLHMQVALQRGGRVIVSDPIASRLKVASQLGAHDVIDASAGDPVERVKELTEGRGADCVIVAVGAAEPIRQALQMGAVNGRVNLFAGTYPPVELPFDPNLVHYRQLVVTGSHDFTPHHFSIALKLIQHGILRVEPLISHRFQLEDVREAFEATANRSGLKAMVLTA